MTKKFLFLLILFLIPIAAAEISTTNEHILFFEVTNGGVSHDSAGEYNYTASTGFSPIGQGNTSKYTVFYGVPYLLEEVTIVLFASLSLFECSDSIATAFNLWVFVMFSFVVIIIGVYTAKGFIGFFGALLLFVTSWFMAVCVSIFGFIMLTMALFIMVWFLSASLGYRQDNFN